MFFLNRPKIIVGIPIYNSEKYIERCLQSILMQRGRFDCEVYLFEDASTDNTLEVIRNTLQRVAVPSYIKVQLIAAEKNLGRQENYNKMLRYITEKTDGEYVALMDGDDYWASPYRLYRCLKYHQMHPLCPASINSCYLYHQTRDYYEIHPEQLAMYLQKKTKITAKEMAQSNPTCTVGNGFYKMSALKRVKEELLQFDWADWLLHFMLSWERGWIGFIPEPLTVYRIHPAAVFSGREKPTGPSAGILKIQDYVNKKFDNRYKKELEIFIKIFFG